MPKQLLLLCLWCIALYGVETDFDYVVVGTSPLSMFEALYKRCEGHRVLVVEQATECGGAWKSLTICGVPNVDLGCHEFGQDLAVRKFLEEYAGCNIICNAPLSCQSPPTKEFYPSRGCYELIHNLEYLLQTSGVILWMNCKLESLFLDTDREIAEVRINGARYTTRKLLLSNSSDIQIENPGVRDMYQAKVQTYPHLYLLIEDPTLPRFTYKNLGVNGASRAMNLTPFAGLEGTGKQLISFQLHKENFLDLQDNYLEELKKQGLLDPSARILCKQTYIYKQVLLNRTPLHQLGESANKILEFIDTGHINHMALHLERWKRVMKPWKNAI